MSRCLIVYFSQGNTTRTIAEAIANGLRAGNHDVDLHNLKDGPPPDQAKYDVLGIGCPAQYYRPAIIVSDYLDSLPGLTGKSVFTSFCTQRIPATRATRYGACWKQKAGRTRDMPFIVEPVTFSAT